MTPSNFIKKFSPRCFYHFTDTRNLNSIKSHGLLSLAELRNREIEIPCCGGNDWSHEADARHGLDGFVHLCLFDQHPMEYIVRVKEKRIQKSAFLKISTDVLSLDGVLFTAGVANKAGMKTLTLTEAVAEMDFEVVYTRTNWKDPEIQRRMRIAQKYELLVPTRVPLKHITL